MVRRGSARGMFRHETCTYFYGRENCLLSRTELTTQHLGSVISMLRRFKLIEQHESVMCREINDDFGCFTFLSATSSHSAITAHSLLLPGERFRNTAPWKTRRLQKAGPVPFSTSKWACNRTESRVPRNDSCPQEFITNLESKEKKETVALRAVLQKSQICARLVKNHR